MSRGILIVMGERRLTDEWARLLAEDYAVYTAQNGAEANAALTENRTKLDGVLLDLAAEGAMDFLTYLPKDSAFVAAIAQSDEQESRALELGAADVLRAPIGDALLKKRVRNLVRIREMGTLRRALERDPLTGIFNRETFLRRTVKLLHKCPDAVFLMQMWDVEHFKVVNDLYGSSMGDHVLQLIGKRLDAELHGVGTYARLDNDHFVICAPESACEPSRLLRQVNDEINALLGGLRVTLYGGGYRVMDRSLTVDQMSDRATLALNTVKGSYHKRFALYDSTMRDRLMMEQEILSEMNGALENGEFCVYYQPLYSITTGQPFSAEALVRWNHPTKGVISPGTFIPIFERNGFITKLDLYVWEQVCRFQRQNRDEGLQPLPVSVNMSRLNLYNPHICETVFALTEKYGIDPTLLRFEITESAYMDNAGQLLEAMKTMQSKGFQILMDDFGSGYSSLNMLKDVPVDILKVDMRFMDDMEHNSRAGSVLSSVIHMARRLDIVVIAEGVETAAQVDFLRSVGCDRVQGFFYSRPLPQQQFHELLIGGQTTFGTAPSHEAHTGDFDVNAFWKEHGRVSRLFGEAIGSVALYELQNDVLELSRASESYYAMLSETPQTLFQKERNALDRFSSGDRDQLLSACKRAHESGRVSELRVSRAVNGSERWFDVKVLFLGMIGLRQLLLFLVQDVTDDWDRERRSLIEQYASVVLDTYESVVDLDYGTNRARIIGGARRGEGELVLDDALSRFAESVLPEDRRLFTDTYGKDNVRRVFAKRAYRSMSIEVRRKDDDDRVKWVRLTLYPMEGAHLLSCRRIIDEQKQNERIRQEYRLLQAKQREQERYGLIVEQTQTALLEWNDAQEECVCNHFAQSYGMSALTSQQLFDGEVTAEAAPQEELAQLRALLRGAPFADGLTVRLKRRDGTMPWCKVGLNRIDNGERQGFLMTINDIDRAHRAQEQLEQQRAENGRRLENLRRLYHSLPCGILQLEPRPPFHAVFANRACYRMFGFATREELNSVLSVSTCALIPEEERETFRAKLLLCTQDDTARGFETSIVRADGSEGQVRGTVYRTMDDGGLPIVQVVFMDTTDLRQKERQLRETSESLAETTRTLQSLLDRLPVGIALFELKRRITPNYVNESAYRMLGMTQTHDMERFGALMHLDDYPLSDEQLEEMRGVQDSRKVFERLFRPQRDDGSLFHLRCYATINNEAATPLCYAVLVDVTEQMKMELAYRRQSELYRMLIEVSQDAFFEYDAQRDLLVYSIMTKQNGREERRVEGYTQQLANSTVIAPDSLAEYRSRVQQHRMARKAGEMEFRADFWQTGEPRWYRAVFTYLEADESFRFIGRVNDIEEEKRNEEQLHRTQALRSAVSSLNLFIFDFDLPDMHPMLVKGFERRQNDYYPYMEYLDEARMAELVHPDERGSLQNAMNPKRLLACYHAGEREQAVAFRALTQSGAWVWLELTMHLSHGENDKAARGLGFVKVIEERKALEQRAETDGVTRLLNRFTVEERIGQSLREDHGAACLMILDVDNFKAINDTFGHTRGDELLRSVADCLRGHFRQNDLLGRLGGDEFVVLMRGMPANAARRKADQLRESVEALSNRQLNLCVSVSIGMVNVSGGKHSFTELYELADKALYHAKKDGKNRCCTE